MAKIIKLPEPNQDGSISLEQAIAGRRSRRNFLPKTLTTEQIGQLTWATQGQRTHGKYRTVPSAGATYPLELFVTTGDGLFHYLPANHSLEQFSSEDFRGKLALAALGQDFIQAAPLTLVFAARFNRTTAHYASVSKVLTLPDYLEPIYMVVVGYYRS